MAYILTSGEVTGIDVKSLAGPVFPEQGAVYTNLEITTYDDLYKLYHYVIYPHYLKKTAAVISIPNLIAFYRNIKKIRDPHPIECPLTAEKIIRHLSRYTKIKTLPQVFPTPHPEPLIEIPLDKDQARAAAHFTGQALVVAPAGSGKTTTLIARVLLLVERGIAPERILCLTFTKKAQTEMQERLNRALGKKNGEKITVRTFHSLANMLLCELMPQKPEITMDRISILSKLSDELEENDHKYSPSVSDANDYIGLKLNSLTSPKQIQPSSKLEKNMLKLYRAYMEYSHKTGIVDQDMLLYNLYELLRDNQDARAKIMDYDPSKTSDARQPKGRWQFVLVDETQDNNLVQDVLTRFIAAPWDNIYWVGDEDQLLYTFRGSSLERILSLQHIYPNMKEYYLKTNYRSCPVIVEVADKLIRQNSERRPKIIISGRPDYKGEVFFDGYPAMIDQYRSVAQSIKETLNKGTSPDDIAVLYRTNSQADALVNELARFEIPLYVHQKSSTPLFQTLEANILLNYARLLSGCDDPEVLSSCIRIKTDPVKFAKYQSLIKQSAYPIDAMRALAETERDVQVAELCADVEMSRRITRSSIESAGNVLQYARSRFNLDRDLGGSYTSDRMFIIEGIAHKFQKIDEFIRWVEKISITCNDDADTEGKVQLMTVHAAKGLEFEIVYIIDCTEGHFPHIKTATPEDLEEERRIFYVAMTRAKNFIYLSGYRTEERQFSRFIKEIGLI